MHSKIKCCCLLYIDENRAGLPNNKSKNIALSYILQAISLNKSLLQHGLGPLTVYTNKVEEVQRLIQKTSDLPISCCALLSTDWVPENVGFSQAHRKIDLLRQLALVLNEGEWFLLLDTDILCLGNIKSPIYDPGAGLVYDISEQCIPAYGFEIIKKDLELLSGLALKNPRWYGGEFLGGDKVFLSNLLKEIDFTLPNYVTYCQMLHHQGDEAIVSSALNRMSQGTFLDVAPLNTVNRYWSVRTRHQQRSFRHAINANFLHLPSEKRFLERIAKSNKPITAITLFLLFLSCVGRNFLSHLRYRIT